MRTFSCLTTERGAAAPKLSLIVAGDERRALELALRELAAHRLTSIELSEAGKVLWVETVDGSERQDASEEGTT